MNNKYDAVHNLILCVLHELAFGGFGLRGDAAERVLRAWYDQDYRKMIDDKIVDAEHDTR